MNPVGRTCSKLDSCRFSASVEVSLLGAIEGMDQPSHRTQGGSHGQCNQSAPQAPFPKQLRARLKASRREQARKAGSARRRIKRIHRRLPQPIHDLFGPLEPAFTRPTYRRFVLLALAAILTAGAHTVANLLRCLGPLAPGDPTSYHRFFSRNRWSFWALARRLIQDVFAHFIPKGTIELAVDDTVTEHPGPEVYGKGCHRDAVRSSHRFTAYRWGHKWVALVVLVKVPWSSRKWALPLLLALYRPKGQARRHKTPVRRAQQMFRVLMRWFPDRRFTCTGDGNYGTHEFASFAAPPSSSADAREPVL